MKLNKIIAITLLTLGLTASVAQAKHHRHHGPRACPSTVFRTGFGFSVGTPIVYRPVTYARPCYYRCRPVVIAPVAPIRPHVGFSFGSSRVGFGFSI